MSSTTHEAILTVMFTDGTVRQYTLPNVLEASLATIKTRVNTINSNLENGQDLDFKQTFVSSMGAPVLKIAEAKAVTTTEEVIYSG